MDEGARTRTPDEQAIDLMLEAEVISAEEAADLERKSRQPSRVRQISGGEVHWFNGGGLARETR